MESFADGIMVLGIPAMVLVPLIVEGLKRLGLPTAWSLAASLLVSLGVVGLAEALVVWPALEPWARVLLGAVLVGFASAGVYSQARWWRQDGEPATRDPGR